MSRFQTDRAALLPPVRLYLPKVKTGVTPISGSQERERRLRTANSSTPHKQMRLSPVCSSYDSVFSGSCLASVALICWHDVPEICHLILDLLSTPVWLGLGL